MSALRNINNELDGTSKAVADLDDQVARSKPARLDPKGLLDAIDKELGSG